MKKTTYTLFLLIAIILVFSACNNKENNASENNQEAGDENSPRIFESAQGEVEVPEHPEKVLAPFHEDTLVALGVKPVAKWAIDNNPQVYLEAQLADIDTIDWTMPKEEVLEANPDLIILENSLDSYDGSYDDYSAIAPTYVMSEEETSNWKTQLELFGQLLQKEDEAAAALENYQDHLEETSAALSDKIGEDSIAMMWVVGGSFFVFEQERFSANMLYNDLNVTVPSFIEELGDSNVAWDPISLEKLSEMDADHMIIIGDENDEGMETLDKSNVWQNTPAVKNDQVYHVEDVSNWTNNGITALNTTMDELVELFN